MKASSLMLCFSMAKDLEAVTFFFPLHHLLKAV
jgi:hypothetical protein